MNVRELITLHEGSIPHAYQDSLGFWTIGVGHLIDKRKGGELPDHIIQSLLDYDIGEHTRELYREFPWVAELDEVRRAVLIDMTFNLGIGGLRQFKQTLHRIQKKDFEGAADAMLESLWAKQVKSRAIRLSNMMRSGTWPTT